jgi:hypothetical protein
MATTPTKAITTANKTATRAKSASTPSQEQIAELAYSRWQDNGGNAEENWLAAEAELAGKKSSTKQARRSRI